MGQGPCLLRGSAFRTKARQFFFPDGPQDDEEGGKEGGANPLPRPPRGAESSSYHTTHAVPRARLLRLLCDAALECPRLADSLHNPFAEEVPAGLEDPAERRAARRFRSRHLAEEDGAELWLMEHGTLSSLRLLRRQKDGSSVLATDLVAILRLCEAQQQPAELAAALADPALRARGIHYRHKDLLLEAGIPVPPSTDYTIAAAAAKKARAAGILVRGGRSTAPPGAGPRSRLSRREVNVSSTRHAALATRDRLNRRTPVLQYAEDSSGDEMEGHNTMAITPGELKRGRQQLGVNRGRGRPRKHEPKPEPEPEKQEEEEEVGWGSLGAEDLSERPVRGLLWSSGERSIVLQRGLEWDECGWLQLGQVPAVLLAEYTQDQARFSRAAAGVLPSLLGPAGGTLMPLPQQQSILEGLALVHLLTYAFCPSRPPILPIPMPMYAPVSGLNLSHSIGAVAAAGVA